MAPFSIIACAVIERCYSFRVTTCLIVDGIHLLKELLLTPLYRQSMKIARKKRRKITCESRKKGAEQRNSKSLSRISPLKKQEETIKCF